MAWSTPRTWVTGEVVTASMMNADIRDNMLAIGAGPVARVRRTSNQSISNAAYNDISFDSGGLDEDTHGMWTSGSPTLLTVPAGWSGVYDVVACVVFSVNTTGNRGVRLVPSHALDQPEDLRPAIATLNIGLTIAGRLRMTAGQTIKLQAFQSSGGALNALTSIAAPRLSARWVRT